MAKNRNDQSAMDENKQAAGDPNMVGSGQVQAVKDRTGGMFEGECWQYGDLVAPILVPDNAEVRVS